MTIIHTISGTYIVKEAYSHIIANIISSNDKGFVTLSILNNKTNEYKSAYINIKNIILITPVEQSIEL